MKETKIFLTYILSIITLNSCISKKSFDNVSLKKTFENDFYIGVALNDSQINEYDSNVINLINKEFNSISPENIMKSMFIHPDKNRFNFQLTDKYIDFGEKYNMFIHGHTLIWHSQLAPWIDQIKDSTNMSTAMTDHISTIVKKYKGRIKSWDVVNEALNEDGTLRKSIFLNTYGKEYINYAFKLASLADPMADLYYNDYNLCVPLKRKGAIDLIQNLQKNRIKIDGVGEQGHWNLNSPSLDEIEKTILDFSNLGIKVAFTELDISVIPNPWDIVGADVNKKSEGNEKMNPYPEILPDSIQIQLAKRYSDIFKIFIKHKDKISRVTFWGVNDKESWLNDWPIKGRTNYPLLFDRESNPKKAYKEVINSKVYKIKIGKIKVLK